MNKTDIKSILGVVLATAIGAGIAIAGSPQSVRISGIPLFLSAITAAYLIQWVAFVFAYVKRSERFFDLVGSLTYISVTTMTVLLVPQINRRTALLLVLVVVWATRLGTFLFTRIQKAGSDDRFDEIKNSFARFLLTWTLQGLWVSLTAAAALAAITSTSQIDLGWFGIIGFAIWVSGYFIELIADVQKSQFKADPNNKGKFIQTGLWAWSRHPNYFGEILIWIGVVIIAFPVLQGWALLTLISPLWVILQLTVISGIPMLENKAEQKWGGQEDYEQYKRKTPTLIPQPPSK